MKEITWHGRGGQGAVLAAKVLATAFMKEGKAAMTFPKYGGERRGAPVTAFNRFDEKPIRRKTQIYYPDCVIVIDPRLKRTVDIFAGIKPNGILVIDSPQQVTERMNPNLAVVGSIDATGIGLEEIGRPITNTCMLGAFARTTGWVSIDSIISGMEEIFSGELLRKNVKCAQRGYEETKVVRL